MEKRRTFFFRIAFYEEREDIAWNFVSEGRKDAQGGLHPSNIADCHLRSIVERHKSRRMHADGGGRKRGWSKKNKATSTNTGELFVFPREMGDS